MKRSDRIKLSFVRNWNFPGKGRLSGLLKTSPQLKTALYNGIIWLDNENIALYTTADNFIECAIITTGTYEHEIGKLIQIFLKPGFVALDVGANIGIQSIRMSKCVGDNGIVYSFEPLDYLQKKFQKNITLNNCTNITLFPLALSDIEDNISIQIDEGIWNQGTFSLKHVNQGSTVQQVQVKQGDNLSEIQAFARLDLIKIDVEGFECHVLRGLKTSIKKHKPIIIFEYDKNFWINNGQSIGDCYTLLNEIGYTFYQISSVGCEMITDPDNITEDNLLCLPMVINE